jgi:type I restriction enzyme S subunit
VNYPDNWAVAELQELGEWKTGSTPRRSNDEYWDGDILWVSPKDMKTDRIEDTQDRMTEKALEETNSKVIPPGSIVVVTRSGILEHSFPVAVTEKPVTINQDLKTFIPGDRLDGRYAYYCLRANELDILKTCTKDGTTVASINSDSLYAYEIPIPPLAHQERIVAKIEELFSKLDSGVSELEDTKNQLDRYRKSTLKAALFGELTRSWRNQQLAERHALDDQMNEYVEEVDYESDAELDGLPDQWRQAPLGSVSNVIPGNSPPSDTYNESGEGLPLINGPSEFGPNAFSKTKQTKFTADPKKECDKDDLIVCVRGNTTGRMNIASTHSAIGRGVAAVRAHICQKFVNYYIHLKESHLLDIGTGTTYPSISSKDLRRLPIPLPTIEEQREIVEILDRRFSILDGVEPEVDENIQRSKRLRQSILKYAFEGNLVPQDPKEEPPTPDGGDTNLEPGEQATLSEVTNDVE